MMLVELGHDVLSASEVDPHASDEALLALANDEQRVLITEDKDFGELVYLRGLRHSGVVRFVQMTVSEKTAAMRELMERHSDALRKGAVVVVNRHLVRIRLMGSEASGSH